MDREALLNLFTAAEAVAAEFGVRLEVGQGFRLVFHSDKALCVWLEVPGRPCEWRFATWGEAVDRLLALRAGGKYSPPPAPAPEDEDSWLRHLAADVRAGGYPHGNGHLAGLLEGLAEERCEHRKREAELAKVIRRQRRELGGSGS